MPLHAGNADSEVNTPLIVRPQLSEISAAPGATANAGHATVEPVAAGAVHIGALIVIILLTGTSILPHASSAVQVSVTVPLQEGEEVKVEELEVPVIRQFPLNPFVKGRVEGKVN